MDLTEQKGIVYLNQVKPNAFKGTTNSELEKLNVKQSTETMHRGMHIG